MPKSKKGGRKRRKVKGDGFIGDALQTLGKIGSTAGNILSHIPIVGKTFSLPLQIGGTLEQELGKWVSSKGFGKKRARRRRR